MKIRFTDRQTFLNIIPLLGGATIISVNDTMREMQQVKGKIMSYSKPDYNPELTNLIFRDDEEHFSLNQAYLVLDAVNAAYEAQRDIYVHCFMGVSRSGAIAKFANEYLGLGDVHLDGYQNYNKHVFTMLCRVAKMGFDPADSLLMNTKKES